MHSFGRSNTHSCNGRDSAIYAANSYYNDVILTHNGGAGTYFADGHAHGSHVIPLVTSTSFLMTMNIHYSSGTHYVSLDIYGYVTGTLGFLTSAQVSNVRFGATSVGTVLPNNMVSLPLPQNSGILSTITTFISSRSDNYVITLGRNTSHPITGSLFDTVMYDDPVNNFNDVIITNVGDLQHTDYYGRAHGSHIVPLKSATNSFDVFNNIGKNEAVTHTAYLNLQIYGYIPLPIYTNVVFLPSTLVGRIRILSTTGLSNEKVTDIIPPNVPTSATAVICNIYSFQFDRADGMGLSFGRNANHDTNIFGTSISTTMIAHNDVLVTYEGRTTTTSSYYYGYSHGSNIIPLKSNGRFDAQISIGKRTTSNRHYIVLQVYGYIKGMCVCVCLSLMLISLQHKLEQSIRVFV
jgi:prepilin-type processing-associated H-X9-DG protein